MYVRILTSPSRAASSHDLLVAVQQTAFFRSTIRATFTLEASVEVT